MVPLLSPTTLPRRHVAAPAAAPRRAVGYAWLLAILALLPVAYIADNAITYSRNIVFWDEFDTALDLILRLDAGAGWREVLQRMFALNNEHRMATSRLLFATSYWLSGTINFHVIGAIGNLFLVGACAILLAASAGWQRRLRLAMLLAFLLFQLEHFENFLWSGASIDHFQVVMLAVAAIAATLHGSARGLCAAVVFATLATFTLAHGTVTWAVCGLILLHQRRWKQLGIWSACGALAAAAFFHGFEIHPTHQLDEPARNAAEILRYWIALLGGPLTLGDAGFAPIPGIALVAGLGLLLARGALTRAPLLMFSALFAVASLGLIAIGRVEIAHPAEINSRYLILGALAWALVIATLLELQATPGRPFRALLWLAPALIGFNVAANLRYAPLATSFIEVRDRASSMFKQHGEDGRGIARLHPRAGHADALLRQAEQRGVYQLPRMSHLVAFPEAEADSDIVAHVDQLLATERCITIGGWGMLPGVTSRRGQIHVLLRSPQSTIVLTTISLQRPDVARAYREPRWHLSGFRAVISPDRLPAEDFEIGVLLADGKDAGFVMTKNRLQLSARPPHAIPAPPQS